ncbi:energy-coupling factor transporter transmembrane component T [Paenibacillus sp. NPDC058910]|uniref:energy-coupling factor transporter transmembrane component T n=1 Tax=Paenibacillus TaxID=44249 RepID=UPI0036860736
MNTMNRFILDLYPTTKMLAVFFVIISALMLPGYIYQYSILPIIIIIALLAGRFKLFISVFCKTIIVIVLFIFIFQVFLIPGETVLYEWRFLSISKEGIMNSLLLTSKLIAISASLILFFQITQIKDFMYSLEKMGVSKKVSFVILSTLQIIPQMKALSNTIADAQRSRGIETEGKFLVRVKAFVPLIGPLILSSIQGTEERVLTLESRAFSSKVKKTHVYHIEKTPKDMIVRIAIMLLFIILIMRRFLL